MSLLDDKKINQSIIKAFTLLEAFTTDHPVWGVRELAVKTGYNKSTVYRLLYTLSSMNLVQQNQNDKYSLGSKLFELGNRVSIYKTLKNLTNNAIKMVALEIQETVLLSILKEDQLFHINKADSMHGLKINTSIGSYQPLHATASGKLLLAYSSVAQQQHFLNQAALEPYTKHTITTSAGLTKQFSEIQEKGFALDIEEFEPGLVCIAIPVKNKEHKTIAALSASGPLSRFKMENVSNYLNILKKGVSNIERNLLHFEQL